jgi:hypothetical protein
MQYVVVGAGVGLIVVGAGVGNDARSAAATGTQAEAAFRILEGPELQVGRQSTVYMACSTYCGSWRGRSSLLVVPKSMH